MPQLEFFSRSQLASWRDRTASRNYSAERDQFRRDHARHREWGLRQRHGRRSMYLRIYGDIAPPFDRDTNCPAYEPSAPPASAAAPELPAEASSGNVSCRRELAHADPPGGEAAPANQTAPAATTPSANQPAPAKQANPATKTAPAGTALPADQAAPTDLPGYNDEPGKALPADHRGRAGSDRSAAPGRQATQAGPGRQGRRGRAVPEQAGQGRTSGPGPSKRTGPSKRAGPSKRTGPSKRAGTSAGVGCRSIFLARRELLPAALKVR